MKQAIEFNEQGDFTLLYTFGPRRNICRASSVLLQTTFSPDRRVLYLNFRLRRRIRNPAYEIQNLQ